MIIFGTVMILAILFLPNGLVGSVKEIPGTRKKLALLVMTVLFVALGFVFNLIMEAAGVVISGLVFPLLFGIVGFIISVHFLKNLAARKEKGVKAHANT